MTSPRRLGAPDAKNRALLLDAAERLLLDEGYAAVSSRRVADRAGLKPQLVHYYFRTMDDLFLDVFRRRAEEGLEQQALALAGPQPLRALWRFSIDPTGTALTMEYVALANHRKALRAEIAHYAERFRAAQVEAVTAAMARHDLDPVEYPPLFVTVLISSLSRVLILEQSLGMASGHAESAAFVEELLTRIEGPALAVG